MGLEKINQFKKELGWTNDDLAQFSGVPKSTIDKITAGKTYDPKLETVKAIVKALGKTLDDLDDDVHIAVEKGAPPLSEGAHVMQEILIDAGLDDEIGMSEARQRALVEFIKKNRDYIDLRAKELENSDK